MKMTFRSIVLAGFIAAAQSAGAAAQDGPIQFRMAAAAGNPSGCQSLDASLSRVHTITLAGDKAVLKSSGGINDTLKQTAPKVYRTTFQLGGVMLDVVADASKSPRTLTIAERQRGCHWAAITP